MPELDDRVDVLETRVDAHDDEVGRAARQAMTATEAHRRNIELLNALRETQAEHTRRLGSIETRVGSIETRVGSIDGTLGQMALGMHAIESILARMAGND